MVDYVDRTAGEKYLSFPSIPSGDIAKNKSSTIVVEFVRVIKPKNENLDKNIKEIDQKIETIMEKSLSQGPSLQNMCVKPCLPKMERKSSSSTFLLQKF